MENNQQPVNLFQIFKNPFVLIFFGVLLFYGRLLVGDMMYLGDSLTYQFPEKTVIRECLQHGSLPFMNPYILSGSPILENISTGALNPLNVLLLLGKPVFGFNLFIFVHVLLAGWAMYILNRYGFGFDRRIACLAAIAYSLGGVLWGMTDKGFIVSAWLIPLFFYGLIAFYSDKIPKKYSWLISVLSLTWLFYTGNLLETYFAIIIGGIGISWWGLIKENAWRFVLKPLGIFIIIVVNAILLSLPQLLPTFYASRLSYRSGGVGVEMAQSWSFPPLRIIEYFVPFAFGGREGAGMYFGKNYIQNAQGAGGSPWFDSVFLGFPLLCSVIFLAVTALRSSDGRDAKENQLFYKRPLFILSSGLIFFFLLALGKWFPLYKLCYIILPGFKVFRHPEKNIEWVNFFLIIIGAYGFELLFNSKNLSIWRTFRRIVLVMLSFLFVIFSIGLGLFLLFPDKYSEFFQSYGSHWNGEQIFLWQAGTLLSSLVFLVFMFVALRVFKDFPKRIIIAFTWITLINLVLWSYLINWTIPVSTFQKTKTWDELLPKFNTSMWRIYGGKKFHFLSGSPRLISLSSLKDNSSALKKVRIPSGFSPLLHKKYYNYFNLEKNPPMRVMDLLSVKYFGAPLISHDRIPLNCRLVKRVEALGFTILENLHACPRIAAYNKLKKVKPENLYKELYSHQKYVENVLVLSQLPENYTKQIDLGVEPKVEILDDLPGYIKLQVSGGPAFVVVRDWLNPGWYCQDDHGNALPIESVEGGLIGVFCNQKESQITISFFPPGLKAGGFASLLGIAIVFLGFGMYCQLPNSKKINTESK